MPKFLVTSKDALGRSQSTVIDASGKDTAIAQVQSRGFFVLSIQPFEEIQKAAHAPVRATRKFSHDGVSLEDIVVFARQLATMLEAGVPLLRSLGVIGEQLDSRRFAEALAQICSDVEQGKPFSAALGKHPRIFSPFWVSLIEVGEASGTMPKVLLRLTEYMESTAKFQSQLIGALIYPAALFGIGTIAVLCFALFVGPVFKKIFADMNMTLPVITQITLGVFDIIREKFYLIILAIVGIVFALKAYVKTPGGRWTVEMALFNAPTLGGIIRLVVVEKFTAQMALLIESGVPILYALEISERLVDNMVCAAVIKEVRESVKEGKLLADCMAKSGFFPSMAVQMIRVGEETGELAKMLGHVAAFYKGQVEEFMKRIATLIEPVMLVVMGGVIGTIVVAMFLPLISLSTGS